MSEAVAVYRFDVSGSWAKTKAYRRDKAVVDKGRRQAHAVDRSNVFVPSRHPAVFKSVEDLAAKEPPQPGWNEYGHAIAVEDNAVLPLFPSATPAPFEMIQRTVDLLMAVEEDKAPLDAERDDARVDKALMTMRIMAIAFLFVVLGGIGIAGLAYMSQQGFSIGGL